MTKISQLTDIGANLAADDEFIIRDVSDASFPNKRVTSSGFVDYIIAQGTGAGFTQIAAGVGPLARVLATSSGATGTLTFSTASATTLVERMRITSAGNVGIGTTASNFRLSLGLQTALQQTSVYLQPQNVGGSSNEQRISNGLTASVYSSIGLGFNDLSVNDASYVAFRTYAGAAGTIQSSGEYGVERVRIDSSGRLLVGTSTANTSGAKLQTVDGLTFPATAVASADPNTLDDYEEGTFTPTIIGTTTAGTGTYDIQIGRYTKIGNRVYFNLRLLWSAHTGTGSLGATGLPFTSNATTNNLHPFAIYASDISLTASNYMMSPYVAQNSVTIVLGQAPTGGGSVPAIPMDTSGQIILSGHYDV